MKILLIHGSPRKKGNTFEISKIIEESLSKYQDVEFSFLFLKDYPLHDCLGCVQCIVKGEDKCPLNDSRKDIQAKMEKADALILISPMYSFHVSTIMKTFIDHFTFLVHRPRFHTKKAMVVGLAGGPQKTVQNYLAKNAHAWGYDVEVKLGAIAHIDSLRPKFVKKEKKKIEKAADNFYRKLKNNKLLKPSVYDLVYFKMWKINTLAGKNLNPADYNYWKDKGWLESNYYYNVRIGPINKILAAFGGAIINSMMHKVYKDY